MKYYLPKHERGLFEHAMQDVKPLGKGAKPAPQTTPTPRATPTQKAAASSPSTNAPSQQPTSLTPIYLPTYQPHLSDLTSEARVFHGEQLPWKTRRILRRGEVRCDATLDLHGLTIAEAETALRQFLQDSRTQRRTCVKIIHGKSRNENHPPIKNAVYQWLKAQSWLRGFCSCTPKEGGAGALWVLLTNVRTSGG